MPGGAIMGGQYYVGRGDGNISANELTVGDRTVSGASGVNYRIAPVVALGDAVLSVQTRGDLRLQTVVDPLMVRYTGPLGTETIDLEAYMSGFTDRTALDLSSSSGNVTLANQSRFIFPQCHGRADRRCTSPYRLWR